MQPTRAYHKTVSLNSRFRILSGAGLFLAGLCWCTTVKAAALWHVSPVGDNLNAGTNWATAKKTIQAGVNAAATGDTVIVTNGVYLLSASVSITNAITLTSANGSTATIIDAQHLGRCLTINGIDPVGATVNGFTFRGGRAVVGGGLYCNGATIQNSVLTNNYASGSDVTDSRGGGVYLVSGTLSNCVVCANVAESTNSYQGAWGGGVYCYGGELRGCTVSNNLCTADNAYGAGIALIGGALVQSRVAANRAVGVSYASGGGVYADILQLSVSSFISGCTISSNTAQTTDNYVYTAASADGGGLYMGNGTVVQSTLVCGNRAQSVMGFTSGGGVRTSGCILENSTVVNNVATTQNGNAGKGGGVIWGYNDECYNNIIVFNSADNNSDNADVNSLSYPFFNNSDIGPNVPPGNRLNCISSDPLFVNPGNGDYRLRAGSPCVNTGTNRSWTTGARDLQGNNRLSGGIVDMGAYEYASILSSPTLNSPARLPGGRFQFQVDGVAGQNYSVLYATQLPFWNTLLSTNAVGSSFTVTDTDATNASRIYRVVVGP